MAVTPDTPVPVQWSSRGWPLRPGPRACKRRTGHPGIEHYPCFFKPSFIQTQLLQGRVVHDGLIFTVPATEVEGFAEESCPASSASSGVCLSPQGWSARAATGARST